MSVIMLSFPLTAAQDTSEQVHEIDLYLSGEATPGSMFDNVNLTTREPKSIFSESQLIEVQLHPGAITYRWESHPFHMNITIIVDVHITIWAACNQSREMAFRLSFGIHERNGTKRHGHGISNITDTKLVYNEPIEFNAKITEEKIEKHDLKEFHTGSVIYLGITPFYPSSQPAGNVTILYNSTSHPSGMTLNTTSVSIEALNSELKDGKASVEVSIADAFGVYDIAAYDVKITDPTGHDFEDFNLTEVIVQEEGKITLNITWDIAENESSNYIINVIVTDNNNNKWIRDFYPFGEGNGPDDGKEEGSAQPFIPLIVTIIISIITGIGAYVNKIKKNLKPPKKT